MPTATVCPTPPRPSSSRSSTETRAALTPEGLVVETLDPESPESVEGTPDAETAEAMVTSLEQVAEGAPSLRLLAEDAAAALDGAGDGEDLDGDGLSDEAEDSISSLLAQAQQLLEPTELPAIQLDPQNPQTDGSQPDIVVARQAVSALQSLATSLGVSAANQERLVPQVQQGLDFLLNSQEVKAWEVDIEAVAEATFEGDVEMASRAVGLFNAYCARCHTSDWSAGVRLHPRSGRRWARPGSLEQPAQCPVHRRGRHDRLSSSPGRSPTSDMASTGWGPAGCPDSAKCSNRRTSS